MKHISIISLLFVSIGAKAEYRVYQYIVKDPLHPEIKSRTITSAMNPQTFRAYHADSVNATLVNTWMCFGHTGNKKTCDHPFKEIVLKEEERQ